MKRAVAIALAALIVGPGRSPAPGYEPETAQKPAYKRNDMKRPRPPLIDPGEPCGPAHPGKAPSDAVVLFDGSDLSAWNQLKGRNPNATGWVVGDGYFECGPRSGSLVS